MNILKRNLEKNHGRTLRFGMANFTLYKILCLYSTIKTIIGSRFANNGKIHELILVSLNVLI